MLLFMSGKGSGLVSLYQENIFRLLREGNANFGKEDFFFEAIDTAVSNIGKANNSDIVLSPSRVWEAQELWDEDLRLLIKNERIEGSVYPCEYKHAAFLTYWLRRRVIVESKKPIDPSLGVVNETFNKYTNEFLALTIGLRLSLYSYYVPSGSEETEALEALKSVDLPKELMREAVVYLHHKNVSPHSMYLFFKALLVQLPPPRANGNPLSAVD